MAIARADFYFLNACAAYSPLNRTLLKLRFYDISVFNNTEYYFNNIFIYFKLMILWSCMCL